MKIHEYQAKNYSGATILRALRSRLSEAVGGGQVEFLHPKGTFVVLTEFLR